MTCLRPLCERKATVGVHCMKCRKRFMVRRHNARQVNRIARFNSLAWPCYQGSDLSTWVDDLLDALEAKP